MLVALELRRVRRTEAVGGLVRMYEMAAALGLTGILLVAAAGLYMAATVWGFDRGWVEVGIFAFALMAPVGPLVVMPRFERINQKALSAGEGPLTSELAALVKDPVPKLGMLAILGDLCGIVFVMTLKPPLAESIAAVIVSISLGLLLGLPWIGKATSGTIEAFMNLERNNPYYRR